MEDYKNRRKNYYIKKKFQSSFILKFCLLVLAGSLISGAIVYWMSRATVTTSFENLRLVMKSTADFMLPAVFLSSAIVIVVIGIATVFITLFTSHKIAGPLYRIEKDVNEVASGDLRKEFNLRAGDEIRPIIDALNLMTHFLRDEVVSFKAGIDELERMAAKGSLPAEAKAKIEALKAKLGNLKT